MTTPTIENLSKHINKSRQTIYHMKKVSPNQFQLLWNGWLEYCKGKND